MMDPCQEHAGMTFFLGDDINFKSLSLLSASVRSLQLRGLKNNLSYDYRIEEPVNDGSLPGTCRLSPGSVREMTVFFGE